MLFRVADLTGVVANGVLGGVAAHARRFDMVGVVVLALITALGGGALRDVLLNTRPVALTDPWYPGCAIAGAVVASLLPLRHRSIARVLVLTDFLALGTWAATGTAKSLAFGVAWLPAVLLGVLTAVGGGIMRDVLLGQTPVIFRAESPLYATVGLLCAFEMLAAAHLHHPAVGTGASILLALVMGTLARTRRWSLPMLWDAGGNGPAWRRPGRSPSRTRTTHDTNPEGMTDEP